MMSDARIAYFAAPSSEYPGHRHSSDWWLNHRSIDGILVDGGFLPRSSNQGDAAIHHVVDVGPVTVLAIHDFTGDDRKGSHCTLVVQGFHGAVDVLGFARRHFPRLMSRIEAAGQIEVVESRLVEQPAPESVPLTARVRRAFKIIEALAFGLRVKIGGETWTVSDDLELVIVANRFTIIDGVETDMGEIGLKPLGDLSLKGLVELTEKISEADFQILVSDHGLNKILKKADR
jgi:hypothetical protein